MLVSKRSLWALVAFSMLFLQQHPAYAQDESAKEEVTADSVLNLLSDEDDEVFVGMLGVSERVWRRGDDPRIATIPTPRASCWACEKLATRLTELEDRRLGMLLQMDNLIEKTAVTKEALRTRAAAIRLDDSDAFILPLFLPSGVRDHGIATDESLRSSAEELVALVGEQQRLMEGFQILQDAAAATLSRFKPARKTTVLLPNGVCAPCLMVLWTCTGWLSRPTVIRA